MSFALSLCRLLPLVCFAFGCTTATVAPLAPEAMVQETGQGFLAMTIALDRGEMSAAPSLTIEVKQADGTQTLKAMNLKADKTTAQPLLFALPPGNYQIEAMHLRLPGGRLAQKEFADSDQALALEHELPPLVIEAGKTVHIGVIKLQVAQTLTKDALAFQTSMLVTLAKPNSGVWAAYTKALQNTKATYAKKDPTGQVHFIPWTLTADAKDQKGFASGLEPQTTRADTVARQIVHEHQAEVDACYLKNSAKAHGRVEFSYTVTPAGHVAKAEVKNSTLHAAKTEACIASVLKHLVFPVQADGADETWTAAWSF